MISAKTAKNYLLIIHPGELIYAACNYGMSKKIITNKINRTCTDVFLKTISYVLSGFIK